MARVALLLEYIVPVFILFFKEMLKSGDSVMTECRPSGFFEMVRLDRKEIESLRQKAKQDFNQTDGGAALSSQIESEDVFRREAMKVDIE